MCRPYASLVAFVSKRHVANELATRRLHTVRVNSNFSFQREYPYFLRAVRKIKVHFVRCGCLAVARAHDLNAEFGRARKRGAISVFRNKFQRGPCDIGNPHSS